MGGARFAFYGRVSTEDQQDPNASRNWQLRRTGALIEPHRGVIVKEYFDVGQSRSVPWRRRPEAEALLEELRDPDRGFDAVVIGEPQRAFYGNQFGLIFPLFAHYDIPLWVPEVGGCIDPNNEAHDLIMSVFGGMSKGERNRLKVRVRAAMASQAAMEGRFLGGRPPYGYQLIDLGPHPNPAKAADGKRQHGLALDPVTSLIVNRIFDEFVAGAGLFRIADDLTREGVPCPSAYDRARNRHREGTAWCKTAVRAILLNPRYTGHQVWNRQRKDEVLIDVDDAALGHVTKLRWNPAEKWIWSESVVHAPIVDMATFEAAQQILAGRGSVQAPRSRTRVRNPYVLRGMLLCGICRRRMQGHFVNGIAYYRCRVRGDYEARGADHPASLLLREDPVVDQLDGWLCEIFSPDHVEHTVELLDRAQAKDEPDPAVEAARATIADCEAKLVSYRAAIDAGADPVAVAPWITETEARRTRAQAAVQRPVATRRLSKAEIATLVDSLSDAVRIIRDADPEDKAEVYRQLGLRLTYDPDSQRVRAEADLQTNFWVNDSVRGGT